MIYHLLCIVLNFVVVIDYLLSIAGWLVWLLGGLVGANANANAPCSMPYALCSVLYALCPMLYAPWSMPML